MTIDDIRKVMEKEPRLTDHGIGIFEEEMTDRQRAEKFEQQRAKLLTPDAAEACTKACEWLQGVEQTKAIDETRNSYGLKHDAEDDIGDYITNGQFIAAAIHCGFKHKTYPGSPNVSFNMSKKSLNAKRKNRHNLSAR